MAAPVRAKHDRGRVIFNPCFGDERLLKATATSHVLFVDGPRWFLFFSTPIPLLVHFGR